MTGKNVPGLRNSTAAPKASPTASPIKAPLARSILAFMLVRPLTGYSVISRTTANVR